jgi:oligosaccharyltransferase complex subunit gamma
MLQTAPVILIFQPTLGPDAKLDGQPIRFDLQSSQSAEQMHGWVSRNLPPGPRPPLVRPFNYVGLITATTLVLGLITFVTVAKPYILPIIQNRNLWAGVSLIAILLFTSGHMFNHIRKVPYVSGDGKGGITYFAGGFSNQFGMETQIVAAMCKLANQYPSILAALTKSLIDGLLSFATIALALKVPRMADPKSQQVAVFIWASVILGMYSFLLSVFRTKNGGYPFWLPPF